MSKQTVDAFGWTNDELHDRIEKLEQQNKDLISACKQALSRLEDPYLGEDDERQKPEIEMLLALLKKVEGYRDACCIACGWRDGFLPGCFHNGVAHGFCDKCNTESDFKELKSVS